MEDLQLLWREQEVFWVNSPAQCLETFPESFGTSQKLVVENWTWGRCVHCTCYDLLWLEKKIKIKLADWGMYYSN